MAKRAQLVCQYIENMSRDVLEKYQDVIRNYIKGGYGVYALYQGQTLYYVGLAKDLRSRLKQHLRDRHSNSWDRFSVYLTIGDAHLKEMESLLLRILKPAGNKQSGKFVKCENLSRRFKRDRKLYLDRELDGLMGHRSVCRKEKPLETVKNKVVLAKYIDRSLKLRARYKDIDYRASVRRDGIIRMNSKLFMSPSQAAVAVVGHAMNGWWFWMYEKAPGYWVRLSDLRK